MTFQPVLRVLWFLWNPAQSTGFALDNLQARGTLFIGPGQKIYEGMIIGENSRDDDMDVNPCKQKKLTNMRASGTDDMIKLTPPKVMELEDVYGMDHA